MIVLQGQEKIFLSKAMEGSVDVNKQYTKITFTPTQADRLVLAFRNWLRRHGNSQPEWFGTNKQQPLPSTLLSKRQVWKLIVSEIFKSFLESGNKIIEEIQYRHAISCQAECSETLEFWNKIFHNDLDTPFFFHPFFSLANF